MRVGARRARASRRRRRRGWRRRRRGRGAERAAGSLAGSLGPPRRRQRSSACAAMPSCCRRATLRATQRAAQRAARHAARRQARRPARRPARREEGEGEEKRERETEGSKGRKVTRGSIHVPTLRPHTDTILGQRTRSYNGAPFLPRQVSSQNAAEEGCGAPQQISSRLSLSRLSTAHLLLWQEPEKRALLGRPSNNVKAGKAAVLRGWP